MPKKKKEESEKKKEIKLSEADFKKKVTELGKQGITSEKIGEKLRQEGIHPKEYKEKISKILKKNNAYENPDIKNIQNKLNRIMSHYEKNRQDKRAMREKDRIFARMRKLKKYFRIPLK